MSKKCIACHRELPESEFRFHSYKPSVRIKKCGRCSVGGKGWARNHPDKAKASVKRWNNSRRGVDFRLKRAFGIGIEEFDAILELQKGRCAICGASPDNKYSLHLDHCHATGVIRGILCRRCNHGIGHFDDDVSLIESAASYLRSTAVGAEHNHSRLLPTRKVPVVREDCCRDMSIHRIKQSSGTKEDPTRGPLQSASGFAAEITVFNTRKHNLGSQTAIATEHVTNNDAVRATLLDRGIRPEDVSPEEDVKNVERRLAAADKKTLGESGSLDKR